MKASLVMTVFRLFLCPVFYYVLQHAGMFWRHISSFTVFNLKGYVALYCFLFSQLEEKVQQGERDFEQMSKTIRKEVGRFEVYPLFQTPITNL